MTTAAKKIGSEQTYVWYVGYGSNLCKERFLCYIFGGKFKWGGTCLRGCTDKSPPVADKPIRIPYRLYFAGRSNGWGGSGVAFIYPKYEPDESKWTLGRMWKITCKQYEEVKRQEGRRYNHEICLGEKEGLLVLTITSKNPLTPNKPSVKYLKTMILGLRETYSMTDEDIVKYLEDKKGIRHNYTKEQLKEIVECVCSR